MCTLRRNMHLKRQNSGRSPLAKTKCGRQRFFGSRLLVPSVGEAFDVCKLIARVREELPDRALRYVQDILNYNACHFSLLILRSKMFVSIPLVKKCTQDASMPLNVHAAGASARPR